MSLEMRKYAWSLNCGLSVVESMHFIDHITTCTVRQRALVEPEDDFGARKLEYIDVIVSDVQTKNGFSFSVQILNTEGNFIG